MVRKELTCSRPVRGETEIAHQHVVVKGGYSRPRAEAASGGRPRLEASRPGDRAERSADMMRERKEQLEAGSRLGLGGCRGKSNNACPVTWGVPSATAVCGGVREAAPAMAWHRAAINRNQVGGKLDAAARAFVSCGGARGCQWNAMRSVETWE
jgi:hypothetical protein